MLPRRIRSSLLGSITVLAVASGGLTLVGPGAFAADGTTAARTAVAHRASADAACRKAGTSVASARAAVRKAPGRSAKAVRARTGLAKALVAQGRACLRTVSVDDLVAMLPPDVAAEVSDLIAQIKTRLAGVSESIPGSNASELDKIISRLDALDADRVVGLLADLADQLAEVGDDPDAVATILTTVFDGMGEDPGSQSTDDPGDDSTGDTDPGDGSFDDGSDNGSDDLGDGSDELGDGTDLTNGTDLPDLATILQQLVDELRSGDLTGAWTQVRGQVKDIVSILRDTAEQLSASHPELQVLVDLFDEIGFGDLDDTGTGTTAPGVDDLADGFAAVLGHLFDQVGRGSDSVEHGIGGLLGSGPGGTLFHELFGTGAGTASAGLADFLGGLFGGLGSGGLFGGLFGGAFGSGGAGTGGTGGFFGGLLGSHQA